MIMFSVAGDEDVIQVDEDKSDATEDAVYQPLECLGGVLETKGHAEELPEPKGSDDGRLGDICRHNRNLVVAAYQVHLGEDLLARQTAIEILYVGQWYLSSTVALLRRRKSPQGLQPPLGLETM